MPFEKFLSADARVMKSSLIRQLTGLVNQPDVISFAAGSPNAETFPHEQLAEIFNDLVARERGRLFQYCVTRGVPELVEAVRERLERVKEVRASTQETILVSGSQQGLDFVARVLLDPGDAVFVELPNFIGATGSFEHFQANVVGVKRDAGGMDLADLEKKLAEVRAEGGVPKLIYVIPNFQNPSGSTWSQSRRRALYEFAVKENLLIFEDDAYGEIYHSDAAPADLRPIKALDGDGRVLYMSTFSKILAPGLRLAWIAGPKSIIRRIEQAKETGDLCSSTPAQKLTLEFLKRGWLDPHLARVRKFYEAKCLRMHEALERHFQPIAQWSRPRGGLFLWVELAAGIDTLPLLQRAVNEHRTAFIPGQPFFVDGSGANTLRLSFSNVTDENIEIGLGRLRGLIDNAAPAPLGGSS